MKISYIIAMALCVMVLGSVQRLGVSLSQPIAGQTVGDRAATQTAELGSVSVAADLGGATGFAEAGAQEGVGGFWTSLTRRNEDPNAEPWKRVWWRGALATGAFAGSTFLSLRTLRSLAGRLAIGPLRATPTLLRGAIAAGIVDIGRLLLIEVVPNLAVFLYDQLGLDSRFGLFGGKEIAGQEVARTARTWTSRLFAVGTALTLTVAQEVGGLLWGHDPIGLKEVFLSNYNEWFERIDHSKEKVWNFFGVKAPSEAQGTTQTDWWQGIKEAGRLTALGASADSARSATSRFNWSNLHFELPFDLPFVGDSQAESLSVGSMTTSQPTTR